MAFSRINDTSSSNAHYEDDHAQCAASLKSMMGYGNGSMRMQDLSDVEQVVDSAQIAHRQEDARDENPIIHRPRTLPNECVFTCGQMCAWICRFVCIPPIVYANRHSVVPRHRVAYAGDPYEQSLFRGITAEVRRGAPNKNYNGSRYAKLEISRSQIDDEGDGVETDEDEQLHRTSREPLHAIAAARTSITDDDVHDDSCDDDISDEDASDSSTRIRSPLADCMPSNSFVPRDSAVDVLSSGDEDDNDTLARFSNTRVVTTSSVIRQQIRRSDQAKKSQPRRAVIVDDEGEESDSGNEDDQEDEAYHNDVLSSNDTAKLDGFGVEVELLYEKKRALAENLRRRESSNRRPAVNTENSSLLQDGLGSDSDSGGDYTDREMSPSDRVELICTWLDKMRTEIKNVTAARKEHKLAAHTTRIFIEEVSKVLDDRIFMQFQQGIIEELPQVPLCFGDP